MVIGVNLAIAFITVSNYFKREVCEMKKVLVIGAAGVLGRMVCQELIRIWQDDIHLTVSDYRTERGRHLAETLNANYCNVDMENRRSIQKAVQRVDCVVVVLNNKRQ